jgi:predicted O-methyltransferase YrrM
MIMNSTGTPFSTEFLGMGMQQNYVALSAFDFLFKEVDIHRVIEIGTAAGGLTVFLALAVPQVVTLDIADYREYRPTMNKLGIDFRCGDVFQHIDEIRDLINLPGTSLVLCDGGNKPLELRTFAPFLKPGDIIAAHDYATEDNEWGFSEIRVEDADGLDYLEPFLSEVMGKAAWLSFRRKESG